MGMAKVLGVILLLAALLAGTVSVQAASAFAPIEIRLVAQERGEGPVLDVEGRDRTLEVEPETLLGPSDFQSVGEVEWTEGKPGFNVALKPSGAKKYERVSAENVGRTLAIIVDGKILMAGRILDPVRVPGFLLTVNSEAEARDIAAKLGQAIGSR